MLGLLARTLIRTVAGLLLAAAVGGLPAALVAFVGWPLPSTLPSVDQLTGWLHAPVSDQAIVNLLAVAAWLLWAAFVHATLLEARAAWRGLPARGLGRRSANPLRLAAGLLITALTLGTVLSAAATAVNPAQPRPPAVATQTTPQQPPGATAAAQGAAFIHVGQTSYRYVVVKGDYLSKIAAAWLGDANRWPEICELNWHRHWPNVGGTLHDCDLIYPGWDLKLPADARPPADATPAEPQRPEPPATPEPTTPAPTTTVAPQPTPSVTLPPDPDGVVQPPAATAPPATPSVTAEPSPTPASPSATAPASSEQNPPPGEQDPPPGDQDDDSGVTLPGGSYLPWTLAAAIAASAAWVWLQRRRRTLPTTAEDLDHEQAPELPPPVAELQRQVTRRPGLAPPVDLAERAAAVPELPPLPEGGVGLVGDGAHPAARAALVAALASGGPRDPDRRGEVVIDGTTLSTLIGADAARLGPWPRLHIADDLDHALTLVEARLLHRSRILDDHSLTDLDTLRDRAPDEEPLPPVLLIAETPPPGARMRARVSLGLGTGLDVAALLLGAWDHGTTLQVAADGYTNLLSGPPVDTIGERMAVLDTNSTAQILDTLREAHTGEPPTITTPPQPREQPDSTGTTPREEDEPHPAQPATTADDQAASKVRLCVLGPPRVEDIRLPGRPPRAKALELAVYLACHPGGAPTRELGEYLNPEARVREADQRVHTNASNLRHVLGRAGGPRRNAYLVKTSGRYQLDPTTVEVDLWRLRELLKQATAASGDDRRQLALQACQLYTAPLADGCDYEWVEPYREKTRRWGTQAHLLAAGELLDIDPQQAADLLDKAISLDPYNEQLYGTAMHARHALGDGDGDGIRTLLRALTKALGDLDAEPTEETIDLAHKLRASLDQR